MSEVNPTQKPAPHPTFYREGMEAPGVFNFLYKLFCHLPWIGDCIANLWINSLAAGRVYNFENLTHYEAPTPGKCFTKVQRKQLNPYIAKEFINTMERMKNSSSLNPYVLAYTHFSRSFYKKDRKCKDYVKKVLTFNSTPSLNGAWNLNDPKTSTTFKQYTGYYNRCHNAFSKTIKRHLQGKTSLHIGIPYAEKDSGRSSISPDFIEAVCPLLRNVTELYIHGPIASNHDRAKLLSAIKKIQNLQKLHFEVDPTSAAFFIRFFPKLLQKPNLTELKLHNLKFDKKFLIENKTWEEIGQQERCTITLQNTLKNPTTIECNNKLQFKSPIE